ncbi:MAG: alpha/beta hydrolase [Bacteroidota bacterium]
MRIVTLMLIGSLLAVSGHGQELVAYKTIDTTTLYLEVHRPADMQREDTYPALIFFFGGGWRGGDRGHFRRQARYLSKRGLVCFLADYRTFSKHATDPFESLKDAKSAMRFLRKHAGRWQVDPNRIIAAGGSAGGHLAAATALVRYFDDPADDLTISPVPNALVLFNPVIDNGPGGYGYERVGEPYRDFSPLHNIRSGAPPTLLLLGTEDALVPVETAEYYRLVMEKVGSRCDLILYEGSKHGFFNYGRDGDRYQETLTASDEFLQSLGYLSRDPVISME